jgi:hypothetical protein
MNAHTPGPWVVDHECIGPWSEPVALLCDVNEAMTRTVIAWPRMPNEAIDDNENEANARLIASAPSLLEAAQAAFDGIDEYLAEHDADFRDPTMLMDAKESLFIALRAAIQEATQ